MMKKITTILFLIGITLHGQELGIWCFDSQAGVSYKIDFLLSRESIAERLNSVIIGSIGDTIDVADNTTLIELENISPVDDTIEIVIDTVGSATYAYINAMVVIDGTDSTKIDFGANEGIGGWYYYTTSTDTLDTDICRVVSSTTSISNTGYTPNVYPDAISETFFYLTAANSPIIIKLFDFQ